MTGDFSSVPGFMGRHLPFLLAASDKYIKPAVRYQGCAYDSGVDFLLPNQYFTLWSTSDSQIRSTLETFASAGEQLEDLAISKEGSAWLYFKRLRPGTAPFRHVERPDAFPAPQIIWYFNGSYQ